MHEVLIITTCGFAGGLVLPVIIRARLSCGSRGPGTIRATGPVGQTGDRGKKPFSRAMLPLTCRRQSRSMASPTWPRLWGLRLTFGELLMAPWEQFPVFGSWETSRRMPCVWIARVATTAVGTAGEPNYVPPGQWSSRHRCGSFGGWRY